MTKLALNILVKRAFTFVRRAVETFKRNPRARLWFWTAFTALLLAAFLIFTSEVQEAASGQPELIAEIDRSAALHVGDLRSPRLNSMMVDITALGSATVISILISISSLLLIFKQRFTDAIHIFVAGIGAAAISPLMKPYFERARPVELPHLVEVKGYSYPSGHSLASAAVYFTLAVLLCHSFKKGYERITIVFLALALIGLIALSRVYLGVHYVSDTVAGVLIGISWAAAIAAAAETMEKRSKNVF